jgi:hypothetical protein
MGSGSVMLLVSGLYMMGTGWKAPLPWLVVGLIGLLMIAIVGSLTSVRHLRAIRAALWKCAGRFPGNSRIVLLIHLRGQWSRPSTAWPWGSCS